VVKSEGEFHEIRYEHWPAGAWKNISHMLLPVAYQDLPKLSRIYIACASKNDVQFSFRACSVKDAELAQSIDLPSQSDFIIWAVPFEQLQIQQTQPVQRLKQPEKWPVTFSAPEPIKVAKPPIPICHAPVYRSPIMKPPVGISTEGTASDGSPANTVSTASSPGYDPPIVPASDRRVYGASGARHTSESLVDPIESIRPSNPGRNQTTSPLSEKVSYVGKCRDMVTHRITMDGNCLFRAVSHQPYGDEAYHEIIRATCMLNIELNKDYFSTFVTDNIDNYVAGKRELGVWGDDVEIHAITEIYRLPVKIYESKPRGPTEMPTYHETAQGRSVPPIRLLYVEQQHYDSLVVSGYRFPLLTSQPSVVEQAALSMNHGKNSSSTTSKEKESKVTNPPRVEANRYGTTSDSIFRTIESPRTGSVSSSEFPQNWGEKHLRWPTKEEIDDKLQQPIDFPGNDSNACQEAQNFGLPLEWFAEANELHRCSTWLDILRYCSENYDTLVAFSQAM